MLSLKSVSFLEMVQDSVRGKPSTRCAGGLEEGHENHGLQILSVEGMNHRTNLVMMLDPPQKEILVIV